MKVGARARKPVLLFGSIFFYGAWNPKILILLAVTAGINYFAALRITDPRSSTRIARGALIIAIAANLGSLGFFKYFNFFVESMNVLMHSAGFSFSLVGLNILLPLGISFYTFQITAYIVDVYRREIRAEKNFSDLFLFLTYFPQLVSGPIERASRLMPLLKKPPRPTTENAFSGLQLALWGLFQKVFIADNIAQFTEVIFAPGAVVPRGVYMLGGIALAFQIYADFSGYIDTARGLSRMLGIELTLNFNLPFFAPNPVAFWKRWHISLGAFLRDYLYIPMGGNRMGMARTSFNLILVWGLGGLWHGAGAGYILWGLYSGATVALYFILRPLLVAIGNTSPFVARMLAHLGRPLTFILFVIGLYMFFMQSFAHLGEIIGGLFSWSSLPPMPEGLVLRFLFFSWPLILAQIVQFRTGELEFWKILSRPFRIATVMLGFVLFIGFGIFESEQYFYFQF